jgi:hypothetical protein
MLDVVADKCRPSWDSDPKWAKTLSSIIQSVPCSVPALQTKFVLPDKSHVKSLKLLRQEVVGSKCSRLHAGTLQIRMQLTRLMLMLDEPQNGNTVQPYP